MFNAGETDQICTSEELLYFQSRDWIGGGHLSKAVCPGTDQTLRITRIWSLIICVYFKVSVIVAGGVEVGSRMQDYSLSCWLRQLR